MYLEVSKTRYGIELSKRMNFAIKLVLNIVCTVPLPAIIRKYDVRKVSSHWFVCTEKENKNEIFSSEWNNETYKCTSKP